MTYYYKQAIEGVGRSLWIDLGRSIWAVSYAGDVSPEIYSFTRHSDRPWLNDTSYVEADEVEVMRVLMAVCQQALNLASRKKIKNLVESTDTLD